jgi:peroxiredoxin
MVAVGSPAPGFVRPPVCGKIVDLGAITADRPLLLVFFRYSGSPQTRRDAVALNATFQELDLRGVAMAGVIEGSGIAVRDFVPRFKILYPMVHDEDGSLHAAFEVGRDRGLVRTLLRPDGLRRWSQALQFGHGWPEGPVDRRSAAVVIGKGGTVVWTWEGKAVTDTIDPDALREAAIAASK